MAADRTAANQRMFARTHIDARHAAARNVLCGPRAHVFGCDDVNLPGKLMLAFHPVRTAHATMNKKQTQLGLPLASGGPTLDGYPTVFLRARPEKAPDQAKGLPRPVLTSARIQWLMQLHTGPSSWRRKRGKAQEDCMALGWTEWSRDADGDYRYDRNAKNPRVMEQLTPKGREVIGQLIGGRRIDARPKKTP